MRAIALVAMLFGCTELVQNHPLATAIAVGTATTASGAYMAAEGHQTVGGFTIGIGVSTLIVAIPIAVIIDNFNEAHRH